MQYDSDIVSPQSELFLRLRAIILSSARIKERKNAKQTSYYDSCSAVCFLRVRRGKVRLSFANGNTLSTEYPALMGDAKIVRYLEFSDLTDIDAGLIRAMIDTSLLLNIEKEAMKGLKKVLRQQH